MLKKIIATVLLTASLQATAMEDFEATQLVVDVLTCAQDIKTKKPMGRFASTNRYNQWIEIRNARQVSGTDFEFLVETKDGNGYQWISVRAFNKVKCDVR